MGGGGAGYVFSGATGQLLYALPPSAAARQFGTFFLAGVGDVNRDRVPDIYGGDYAAGDNGLASGFAGVYSGRDGTLLRSWFGAEPGAGLGPGRGAGDVDRDHRPDIAIGSYQSDEGARTRARSSSTPARPARSCARSPRRPRARTSASTPSAPVTSTATASPTCSPRRPRATPST